MAEPGGSEIGMIMQAEACRRSLIVLAEPWYYWRGNSTEPHSGCCRLCVTSGAAQHDSDAVRCEQCTCARRIDDHTSDLAQGRMSVI